MIKNLREVLLGTEKVRMGLTDIHSLRNKLKGKETEADNIVPLLLARIAEIEIIVEETDELLCIAGKHIEELEGKPNFLTEKKN